MELSKVLRAIISMTGLVAIAAAIGVWGYLALQIYQDTKSVGKSLSGPFTVIGDTWRSFRGTQVHDVKTKVKISQLPAEDQMFAVMIAKDSDGEPSLTRYKAMLENADAALRLRELGISIPESFRKCHLWVPLDWDHGSRAWKWIDRELDRTVDDIPSDILEQAIEITLAKKKTKPDPAKCAVHIIRPKDHSTSFWSGEYAARKVIASMTEDPEIKKLKLKTRYFCRNYKKK
jgi:hypothetical protein